MVEKEYIRSPDGRCQRTSSALSFSTLSRPFDSPEISLGEVRDVGRMNGPEVALAVGCSAGFDEAIVEGEIVPDRIPPAGTAIPEISVVVQDPLPGKR